MGNGGLGSPDNGGPIKDPAGPVNPVLEEWSYNELERSVSGGGGPPVNSPEELARLQRSISDPGRKRWWEAHVDGLIIPNPRSDRTLLKALNADEQGAAFFQSIILAGSSELVKELVKWERSKRVFTALQHAYGELLNTRKADYLTLTAWSDQNETTASFKMALLLLYATQNNYELPDD